MPANRDARSRVPAQPCEFQGMRLLGRLREAFADLGAEFVD
jgi:hypothetical protein